MPDQRYPRQFRTMIRVQNLWRIMGSYVRQYREELSWVAVLIAALIITAIVSQF